MTLERLLVLSVLALVAGFVVAVEWDGFARRWHARRRTRRRRGFIR